MNAKARIIVKGLVQGVFFRAFTKEKALHLNLKGFVRNLSSGDEVEVVVLGRKQKIIELTKLLKRGPPSCKVESIEIEWLPVQSINEFTDFKIKY